MLIVIVALRVHSRVTPLVASLLQKSAWQLLVHLKLAVTEKDYMSVPT